MASVSSKYVASSAAAPVIASSEYIVVCWICEALSRIFWIPLSSIPMFFADTCSCVSIREDSADASNAFLIERPARTVETAVEMPSISPRTDIIFLTGAVTLSTTPIVKLHALPATPLTVVPILLTTLVTLSTASMATCHFVLFI